MEKNKNKFLLIFIFTLIISIFISNTAFAASNKNQKPEVTSSTIIVNELEFINNLLNSTDEELANKGLSEEEIKEIREYNYNNDLLAFGKRPTIELEKEGYSQEQIYYIKNYDGSEDAIEYATKYGLSGAELNGYFYVTPVILKKSVEIWYNFTWTSCPIFCLTDNVVVAWVACDSNSNPLLTSVIYEEHETDFYDYSDNGPLYYKPCDVKRAIGYRVLSFGMSGYDWNTNAECYGKETWGYMGIQTASGSSNLSNIIVAVGYGHTVLNIKPSPSVAIDGVSIGIDFDAHQQDLYNNDRNYNYDGTIKY